MTIRSASSGDDGSATTLNDYAPGRMRDLFGDSTLSALSRRWHGNDLGMRMDLQRADTRYTLAAELPDFKREDVMVDVQKDGTVRRRTHAGRRHG